MACPYPCRIVKARWPLVGEVAFLRPGEVAAQQPARTPSPVEPIRIPRKSGGFRVVRQSPCRRVIDEIIPEVVDKRRSGWEPRSDAAVHCEEQCVDVIFEIFVYFAVQCSVRIPCELV
ncbi:hypothetical protein CC86DRAFT_46710 [Ophiobolus disseminans]|uniref:Uncharacterized protein n=1 Tax=Ophiobolus disseminans TaxID=1469910 RepID=A0A6A6ZUN2_9PLEO|nr:hypothetical protein CC86DRAFT_46710 [Ophiobolus disseminans]